MRSTFWVMSKVVRPNREAAMAASHPACPAPTTIRSKEEGEKSMRKKASGGRGDPFPPDSLNKGKGERD